MRKALLAAFLLAPAAAQAADGALALAERFCEHRLAGDEAALRAMLTPGLVELVADAEARNAVIAADAPGDKPPLGDGLPWASFPDMAAECRAGEVARADNLTMVEIGYALEAGGRVEWTDRLVLVGEGDALAVDDILFQPFPTDTYRAGMRRLLVDMFDQ